MSLFPGEPKKIRARITRYERELRKERDKFGYIGDGHGKRYLLGPLYLLMDDVEGAVRSYEWFEQTFPDDIGEPVHFLCWSLALYRAEDREGAAQKLRRAMLSNLYLIPHLLGRAQDELDISHGSNYEEQEFLDYVPPEIWGLWDESERAWAAEVYDGAEMQRVRQQYIAIRKALATEPVGPRRTELVDELFALRC